MIEKKTIDDVIEASNSRIVDIIGDFVSLKRRGSGYVGCCPFHQEKTGSFHVTPSRGMFKCFGCGKGGDALRFVMEHEHLTFVEGIKYLGQKVGITVQEKQLTPEMQQAQNRRESLIAVCEYAKNTFIKQLWESDEGKSLGLPYFRGERGFRDDIIKKFELGYSLGTRDAFTKEALQHGYKDEFLRDSGLTIFGENNYKADRFWGRVMFPIHSISGRVVAFGGRVMKKSDKVAKYINSPETELYHKSDIVYGIFHAKNEIAKRDKCYLVEGYTDVISMHQAGIENVIASSGTSLTQGQIRLIQRFTNNITVLYDGDAAGIHAAVRGIDMILAEGMNVKVLLLPDGEDPDSFARTHNAEDYVAYIEEHQTDFIRFKAQLLMDEANGDPVKKSSLINDIVKTISVVQDTVLRSLYVKECSKMMDIEERTLFSVLEKFLINSTVAKHEAEAKQAKLAQQSTEAANPENSTPSVDNGIPITAHIPKAQNPFVYEEREILRLFVTYVDKKIFANTEQETTVGEYILSLLDSDNIQSTDENFKKIIDVYRSAEDRSSITSQFFINQPDSDVSNMAVDLLSSRAELSKYHERFFTIVKECDMLDDLVPHAMNELQIRIVAHRIDELNKTLREAEQNKTSEEEINGIMEELVKYNNVKRILSKMLGGRTMI